MGESRFSRLMRLLVMVVLLGLVSFSVPAASPPGFTKQELYSALNRAAELEFFSLEPGGEILTGPDALARWKARRNLDGYAVLGSAVLTGQEKRELLVAFQRGVDEKTDRDVAKCFIPHHGLRARVDGHIYTVIICYKCLKLYATRTGGGPTQKLELLTTPSPRRDFESAVARHKLKS